MLFSEDILSFNRSLSELKKKHISLDRKLTRLQGKTMGDDLEICRVKKEKLRLKDAIWRLQSALRPDIIA